MKLGDGRAEQFHLHPFTRLLTSSDKLSEEVLLSQPISPQLVAHIDFMSVTVSQLQFPLFIKCLNVS